MLAKQHSQRLTNLALAQTPTAGVLDERHTELQRPALRTAAAHQRRVQPLTTIAHKLAVWRPLVKGALGKPRLELARDARLAPLRLIGMRHG